MRNKQKNTARKWKLAGPGNKNKQSEFKLAMMTGVDRAGRPPARTKNVDTTLRTKIVEKSARQNATTVERSSRTQDPVQLLDKNVDGAEKTTIMKECARHLNGTEESPHETPERVIMQRQYMNDKFSPAVHQNRAKVICMHTELNNLCRMNPDLQQPRHKAGMNTSTWWLTVIS